jgi:acetyl-CoA synthetase
LLDEWEAKQQLAAYGIRSPEALRVSADDVPAAAQRIAYPLVLKALVPGLAHKTEHGAVALDLRSEPELVGALETMRHLSAQFIVEQMISDSVAELIVGIRHDAQFGLHLLLGSGGVLVELIGDSQLLLLPVLRTELEQALQSLRVWPLLAGYRARAAGDIGALLDTLENILRFAGDHACRLLELDINPLIVRPAGCGVIAADALIHMLPVSQN